MSSTIFDHAYRPARAPRGDRPGLFQRILEWFARIGERSGYMQQAEVYRRLNALSDEELARHGLKREDLALRVFGGRALL